MNAKRKKLSRSIRSHVVCCQLFVPPYRWNKSRISNETLSVFRPKQRTASSIILRGPNDFFCDEMERSVHDALCVVKRVLESKNVVAGGGAVEAALSIYLENFATTLVGWKRLMSKFVYTLTHHVLHIWINVYRLIEFAGAISYRRIRSLAFSNTENFGCECCPRRYRFGCQITGFPQFQSD